jgi:hypothetical protein
MMLMRPKFLVRAVLTGFLVGTAIGSIAIPSPGSAQQNEKSQPNVSASVSTWHTFHSPYIKRRWGVDVVGVRLVASDSMLEFRYKVLDVKKAEALNNKRWNPYLLDQASGAKLAVPTMEKIGQLRQTPPPIEGHVYWMVFANPGRMVKRGNRVNVVVGDFHADGLTVE